MLDYVPVVVRESVGGRPNNSVPRVTPTTVRKVFVNFDNGNRYGKINARETANTNECRPVDSTSV